jgi:LysR family transcriptional regulator, regulator for bpeEF and oprC
MDKLSALRAFVHVAQTGSFTGAGHQLSTGASAITKKIAALEKSLGVRLFHRTTHGVALTDEGTMCLDHARRVLEELDGMEQQVAVRRGGVSGHLRLSMPAAMGQVYVVPALTRFFARHPAVSIQLDYSDSTPDLIESGLDLAIRIGAPRDTRLVARLLANSRRVTCAAPAYLKRNGEPTSVEDLRAHVCMTLLLEGRRRAWRFAGADGDTTWLPPQRLTVNSGMALREAALGELGIVQCNSILVAPELRSGGLRAVLPDSSVASESLYLVYARDRHMVPRVRECIDFLALLFQPYRERA